MRHKCYGTHFQMILENAPKLINLKVLIYHVKTAIVLLITQSEILITGPCLCAFCFVMFVLVHLHCFALGCS